MNLNLSQLLQLAFTPSHPSHELFKNMLGYADTIFNIDATGDQRGELDAMSGRLLWVQSHFISASATSNGLRLGYIELDEAQESTLIPRLAPVAEALPTSLVLTSLRFDQSQSLQTQSLACGGKKSSFEAEDLGIYWRQKQVENRLGTMLVRHEVTRPEDLEFLNTLIQAQLMTSHIIMIHPSNLPAIHCDALTPENWGRLVLSAGSITMEVYSNLNWLEIIKSMPHIDRDLYVDPLASPIQQKFIPMVDANQFGGVRLIDYYPAETLAGADVNYYSIQETGQFIKTFGRLNPVITQERYAYECIDVNVSFAGVIWRDDLALYNKYYLHVNFWDAMVQDQQIAVTEPTAYLAGTYFLVPTSVTNHSHLMDETLRRLSFAESYQPDIKLLALNLLTPSQREYFALFGFPPERCVYKHPRETWRVERLVFAMEPSQRYDRLSIEYLRSFGIAHYDKNAGRPERIYISRRDSRINRNLVNEEMIEKIFEFFGFKVMFASAMSAKDKMEIFSTARYVAGPLGAPFHYLPFSLNGVAIMLTSYLYYPKEYLELAATRMKKSYVIFGVGMALPSPMWGYAHSSFYIPPEQVIGALQEILSK